MMTLPTPAPPALQCPKCAGAMTTYERSGIHVDQCRECRGVFLDRGELERLMDLEADAMAAAKASAVRAAVPGPSAAGGPPPPAPAYPAGPPPAWGAPTGSYDRRDRDWDDDDDDDRRRYAQGGRDDRYGPGYDPRYDNRNRSKKRSFLGDLFEGFGD